MKSFLLLTVLLVANVVNAQIRIEKSNQLSIHEVFSPKMPVNRDTIYYPFYNGVQMIEVDHIGFRDKKVFFLEQSKPRAMSYSDMIPMPIGNEYFFRDSLGAIVKAFNSAKDLKNLTKYFSKVPLNREGKLANFFPFHNGQQYRYDGIWAYSNNYLFNFKGHYKVSTNVLVEVSENSEPNNMSLNKSNTGMFGLIDSFGKVKIPIEYDEIIPWHENLIVNKNGKYGIIDYNALEIVPLVYDSYRIIQEKSKFYPDKKFNIYFLNINKSDDYKTHYSIVALYNSMNQSIIKLNGYNEIHDYDRYKNVEEYENRKITVTKNGKIGVLNSHYEEIVEPQYEMFNYVSDLIHVNKNGKFGFLNKYFEIEIPLEYDYAEYIDSTTFLVLKNGTYYCLDNYGEKKICDKLKPDWKVVHFSTAMDNYIGIQFKDHIGVLDTLTNNMVLPIRYGENRAIRPVFYADFLLRKDTIFKQKNFAVREVVDVYDEISFVDNKIIVKNEHNLYGVIDTSFNSLIDFKYEKLERNPRNPKYLIYRKKDIMGVMDFSRNEVIPRKFNEIRSEISRPFFQVRDKSKWGIVDLKGREVIACKYDSIRFMGHWDRQKENLWIVNKGKKYGVINDKNEVMVPFIYDGISHLHANNLWVMDKDNKRYKVYYSNQKDLKKPD